MRYPVTTMLGLSALAWCASPLTSTAQQRTLSGTPAGERVQLVLRDSLRQGPLMRARQAVIGQFVRAASDSVWIRPMGASELAIARSAIRVANVSRGHSRLRSSLVLGAMWGFALGAGVAIDQADREHDHRWRDAAIGAGVGLGGGLVIGALRPFEHWSRVQP